ncbi:MAG: hypothetical protein IKY91_01890, partial [Akkermansia sp.]|nr:hypothetical protein [Akkermansia sp.]
MKKDVTIANGGKMTISTNDTFDWSNTTNQNVHIDGGTLDLAATRQSFNQHVNMSLNNATILGTGQIDGQNNLGSLDFYETNTVIATGVNLIEASIRLRQGGGGLTFDVQNGTTTVREIHGNKKADNALSVTKSGAGELVLDGTNRAGSLTITNGTVAIDKAATLGAGAVSMTAAEGASTPTLVFRGTETKDMSNAISGAGAIVQAGAGSTTLTGLNAAWTGTIAIQKGTLSTGASLSIGAGRSLEVSNDTTLNSALTLAGGSLVMGSATQAWDADGGLNLGGNALTLDSTNKTQLTIHLAEDDKAVGTVLTLFTNTSITLNEEDTLGTYFSGVISELSHALLSVVDGSLVATIVPENKLEWAPDTDSVWEDGGTIGNNTYVSADMYSLLFGAVTGTEIVTVKGEVAAKEVVITPGADSVYEFDSATDADKITTADIVLESGTLALAAGVLGDDVTISMLGGTTLQWGTTAEASSTEDYSGKLTINGNVTLDVNGNDVILASAISGTAADKTISFASTGATADAKNTVSINGNAVLGSAAVNVGENVVLKLNSSADHTYSNAISGVGSVYLTSTGGANGTTLGGTNTYSGETIIGSGVSKIVAANFSANTSQIRFDSADGTLQFVFDANYTMDKVITGEAGTLNLWGDAANTAFTLSADSSDWNGTLAIYNKRTIVDLTGAVGGDIVFAGSGRTSTLKVHSALSNAIYTAEGANNAGKLIIDGGTAETPIEWDATGKTYTGQTELAAGAHVTTVGSLTTGANSKIVLGEGSQLTITGGSWTSGHTVSGTGALVIANGISTVNGTDKLVTAGQTLSSLVLKGNGTAFEFQSSNQKDRLNTCTSVTVEDGASLIYNVTLSSMTNTIYLNGDGTGEANSAAMVFATFGWGDNSVHTITTDSSVVLGSDSTICVGAHTHGGVTTNNVGVLNGTLTGEGKTLTKTGTGTLRINRIPNVSKIVVEEGILDANAADTWTENITVKDGASMLLSGQTITLSDVTIDAGATTTIITGQANNADSTATLAKVSGSGVIELTRDNDGTRTGDYRVGLTGENADFTGTWKVTGRNVVLQAKHADALAGDTVELSYAGTQTAVSEMSELRLATTGTTVNLGKLTGTAGIVTGSGKTLNIANSETTGVEYSGTIGEGVTIQVSEGYQKITGADKTGSYTLTATGGELDLAGYAHSTDADTGKTTILATAAGKVSNITLGKNMVLTAQLDDVNSPQSGIFPKLGGTLALAGGSLKVHLGNPIAQAAEGGSESLTPIYNAAGMTTYNMNGGTLDLTSNETTLLTFMPETETGKIAANSAIDILVNINSVVDGTKSWKYSDLENKATAAAKAAWEEEIISVLGNKIQTNLSSTGRAQQSWKVGSDSTSKTLSIHVFIEGGAANLEWVAGSKDWDVKNTIAWDSDNPEVADGLFWDDDNVAFNLASGSPETIKVTKAADTDGVRIGSMVVTGGVDYTFKGDAITSGVGLGNVHIGTTGTDGVAYTGTVTFENANSWKGNTNINSGAVVAKNAAALSNTNVNLNGGSLTVDGVALDATVKMLGGVLNTTAAAGGAATVKADLSAAGKDMSVNAATGTTLNLTLVGTEEVAGIIGGNVTINGEVDKEGKPVTTGAVAMGNATVVSGGSLTVSAGDVTTGALVLQDAKKVTEGDPSTEIAAGAVTVTGGSLGATSLANAGSVKVDDAAMSITGAVANTGIIAVTDGSLGATGLENTGIVKVEDASVSITGDVENTGDIAVTDGMLTMNNMVNEGTLTIGGTEMKDVQLGETTMSMPETAVVVNGNLDNTGGTIIIGSAAVADNPDTEDDETAVATYGSLEVTGDLTGIGANNNLVVEAGSSLTVDRNLEAMENVELGIGGTVTVGGNVDIFKLTIAEDALLHATGSGAGSSVEIGTLTGAGTVKVDNGTLHIGALSGFTGTLAGNGTLSTEEVFLLETKQETTTNITGGSVHVTAAANGSSVGLVTTNGIIIDQLQTTGASLSMTGIELKGSDAEGVQIDKLGITLTQMGTIEGVDGIISAVNAADGGIDYHLLSIAGTQDLNLLQLMENEEVHQYLLQKGYAHSDLLSAAKFAATSSTD